MSLPGFLSQGLVRDFARTPLTRFPGRFPIGQAGRRLRVSISLRFARPRYFGWLQEEPAAHPTRLRMSNPLRVFAPARSWHSGAHLPGLCVHLPPRPALPPTRKRSLDRRLCPTRVARIGLGADRSRPLRRIFQANKPPTRIQEKTRKRNAILRLVASAYRRANRNVLIGKLFRRASRLRCYQPDSCKGRLPRAG